MDHLLSSTLLKLAIPVLVIALVLFVSRRRGLAWGADLGLHPPRLRHLVPWLAVWAAWVGLGELAIRAFGLAQARPWPHYPASIVALRILAIGLVGPASEELVMRGLLFARLSRTPLRPLGAVVVCAAGWALMHVQYDWKTWVMIFLDGILLGLARLRSGSLGVPFAMHALGNLFSIYQSLHG